MKWSALHHLVPAAVAITLVASDASCADRSPTAQTPASEVAT